MAIASQGNSRLTGTGSGEHTDGYRAMLDQLIKNFAKNTKTANVLFSVASDKNKHVLWSAYLNSFPAQDRQHYTCNECRKFFERYADLVTIDSKGNLKSVMFSDDPVGEYAHIFAKLRNLIEGASVEHVFVTSEAKWGNPVTGPWEHFAVKPPKKFIFEEVLDSKGEPLETAYQREAKFTAEFKTMVRALVEYTEDHLKTALTILNADALYRGDAVRGPVEWLQGVIQTQRKTKNARNRHNLLWLAVATAPVGFARPRGTKVGPLLDDIVAGMDLKDIRARFAAVMDPTKMNRPQTSPSAGNIKQAERVFDALNLTPSLDRRFATLNDIRKMWAPRPVHAGGVFGHLAPRDRKKAEEQNMQLPSKKMTMEKFVTTVMPQAQEIEVRIEPVMRFIATVTASDPNAKPILQWDTPKDRNPVSWYVYPKGSSASQWGARPGSYVKVNALAAGPSQWNPKLNLPQHGERVMFILDGVKDSNGENVGLALLPEFLISELAPVRKTIEAHNATRKIAGLENASACGVAYEKGIAENLFLRVKTGSTVQLIQIDRWD